MVANSLSNVTDFQGFFWERLKEIIQSKDVEMGPLLLACTNFIYHSGTLDSASCQEIGERLAAKFYDMDNLYYQLLSQGRVIPGRDDDIFVFLKMAKVGFAQLQGITQRKEGDWKVVFSQIRSFRPRRTAEEKVTRLKKKFDPMQFNYNRVKEDENFWHGEIDKVDTYLLYNKFPFANFHTIIVPDPTKELPEFLEKKYHFWLWELLSVSNLPGVAVGYNSLGAYASVNHLHFQLVIDEDGLPVSKSTWRHNRGKEEYPAVCLAFNSSDDSWKCIEKFQRDNQAYNLLYCPGSVYCFPRKFQGTYKHSPWTSGFAFYEMSGAMITFNQDDYGSLIEDQIRQEFNAVKI